MVGWNHVGTSHLCRAPVMHQHWMQELQGGTGTNGLGKAEGSKHHFWQASLKDSGF